jgi:hypothetical protein
MHGRLPDIRQLHGWREGGHVSIIPDKLLSRRDELLSILFGLTLRHDRAQAPVFHKRGVNGSRL